MCQQYGIYLTSRTYSIQGERLLILSLETTGKQAVHHYATCALCSTWGGWNSRHVDSMPKLLWSWWCATLYTWKSQQYHISTTPAPTPGDRHASRFLKPFTTVNSYHDYFSIRHQAMEIPSDQPYWHAIPWSIPGKEGCRVAIFNCTTDLPSHVQFTMKRSPVQYWKKIRSVFGHFQRWMIKLKFTKKKIFLSQLILIVILYPCTVLLPFMRVLRSNFSYFTFIYCHFHLLLSFKRCCIAHLEKVKSINECMHTFNRVGQLTHRWKTRWFIHPTPPPPSPSPPKKNTKTRNICENCVFHQNMNSISFYKFFMVHYDYLIVQWCRLGL